MSADRASLQKLSGLFAYYREPVHAPEILVLSENSRYIWQHLSAFLYTDQIPRDRSIHQLPENLDPALGKMPVTFADGSLLTVDDFFDASTMDAILVLHVGTIIHERYKTMRPFDKHNWFSCTKTLVATLIATLEHEGAIDVAQPVSTYLDELAGSVWDTVTVEAALDMATGLDSTEHEEPDARSNPARGWFRWAESIGLFPAVPGFDETTNDILRAMQRTKPAHTVFEYNSINTYVLQRIVQRSTAQPFVELVGERFWRKIGAEHDAYVAIDKHGDAMGFGFMNSSLRDFGRYGLAFTGKSPASNGPPIVPPAVIEKFKTGLRPQMHAKGHMGAPFRDAFHTVSDLANRYQWDVVTPDGDLFKAGLGGQGLYVCGRHDAVVAFFSTGTFADEARGAWVARTIVDNLGQC